MSTAGALRVVVAGERWRGLVGRLGVEIHPGEGWIACQLFLCFFLFVTFQYVTKSVRQSTFIDSLGASQLPYVYLAVAICSYPAILLYSRLVDRIWRYHLIAGTCCVVAVSLVGFWWLYGHPWNWVPVAFYVWISIVFVMTVSQFWSFANHMVDPRQAKRLFGFVGAGGLLGGMVGGQVARGATTLFGTRHTLLVAVVILLMGIVLVYATSLTARGKRPVPLDQQRPRMRSLTKGGFQVLRQSRHLQLIGWLMLLTVMVAQVVDLQFNWAAEQVTTDLDDRNKFFGNFYTVMGAAAVLLQLAFTSRIHRFLGVGFGMRVLPATMALGTISLLLAASFFPALLIAAALTLKIGENGLRYSLDQATRELLFLPAPSRLRLKAKAYIDVLIQRMAKGLAALLLLPVTFGVINVVGAGWISLALIVVWLAVTFAVVRAYRAEFRKRLKHRVVDDKDPISLSDAHALELVVELLASSNPRRIVHGIELLSEHGRANLVPPSFLSHLDPRVRTKTLETLRSIPRRGAAPQIEQLLEDENSEIRAQAIGALSMLDGDRYSDAMAFRLEDSSPGVRAAAGAYLARADGEGASRATAVIRGMVCSDDPAIRLSAARSLGATCSSGLDDEVLHLLDDREPQVRRAAIAATRYRIARNGFDPLYMPRLLSLLRDRRLKREARDCIVASGEQAISTLVHSMVDPDEPIDIRRALPGTIARIGGPQAWSALIDSLRFSDDPFLRRNVISALASRDTNVTDSTIRRRIESEIQLEARDHLEDLADLAAVESGEPTGFRFGPTRWEADTKPSLLHRLLAERMRDHRENIFNLLQLIHPPREIRAAYDGLRSVVNGPLSTALEYLDINLPRGLRRDVLNVIDRTSTTEKLRKARRNLGIEQRTTTDTLEKLLCGSGHHGKDPPLKVAATHYVHHNRIVELRPILHRLRSGAEDALVRETASAVLKRWHERAKVPVGSGPWSGLE